MRRAAVAQYLQQKLEGEGDAARGYSEDTSSGQQIVGVPPIVFASSRAAAE